MDASLQELNEKIDALTAQVTYLSDQAQLAERQRQARLELVRDVTPLANEAFSLAIEQLEEVQEYIDLNDLLRLFKRLLRNGRNLEKMLDQLESLAELLEVSSPLVNDAFGKAVDELAILESKGYFTFARGSVKLLDNLVASFSEEELNQMSENVGSAVNLVKELIKPEILSFANTKLAQIQEEATKPVEASTLGLVRQMGDPEVRRGLALTLRMMKVIGSNGGRNTKDAQ
jgi:uncharacterized protein YjgD (DUF1641 family)